MKRSMTTTQRAVIRDRRAAKHLRKLVLLVLASPTLDQKVLLATLLACPLLHRADAEFVGLRGTADARLDDRYGGMVSFM